MLEPVPTEATAQSSGAPSAGTGDPPWFLSGPALQNGVPKSTLALAPALGRPPPSTRVHAHADTHTSPTIQMSPAADTLSHARCIPHSQLCTPPPRLSSLVNRLVPTTHTNQTLAGGSPCQPAPGTHASLRHNSCLSACRHGHTCTHALVHTLCPPTSLCPDAFLLCGLNCSCVPFIRIHLFHRWEWS